MAHSVVEYEVKRERGKLILKGRGRTRRGQKFTVFTETLTEEPLEAAALKSAISVAVKANSPA